MSTLIHASPAAWTRRWEIIVDAKMRPRLWILFTCWCFTMTQNACFLAHAGVLHYGVSGWKIYLQSSTVMSIADIPIVLIPSYDWLDVC